MRTWKYAVSYAQVSPITSPLPFCGDLYACMRKAADFGYDAIEFHTRETYAFDFDKIRTVQSECGAGICMLVTGRLFTEGGFSLLDADPVKVQGALAGFRAYIDAAEKLGAGIVIGWAKGNVPPDGDRAEYMSLLAERLRTINDDAKIHGVPVNLEVINHYESNIFNTCQETAEFIMSHKLDNCYIHLDTYHMALEERDPCQAIRAAGSLLGYVHVSDNTRHYPGSGTFDFKKILQALDEAGYTGYVTVECIPDPDRNISAQKAIAHLIACEP